VRLVIVGHGSIGKRHHRNAVSLGVAESDIQVVDPLVDDSFPLDDALRSAPDAVCICTPLDTHCAIATEVLRNTRAAVFIEKPLCETRDDALMLARLARERVAQVGYCWRYHRTVADVVRDISDIAKEGKKLQVVTLTCHSCRSMWPGLPSTYGDAIYEASHEIDLACRFFAAKTVKWSHVRSSEAWLSLNTGMMREASKNALALSPIAVGSLRSVDCDLRYVGSKGDECRTISALYEGNRRVVFNLRKPLSAIATMYRDELEDFLRAVVAGKPSPLAASFKDAAQVVEMIHDAKRYSNLSHS